MDFTCKAFDIPISQFHFHTDSTIVLAWIGSHASRWETFVANRVAKIQTLSSPTQWHHVSGNENPAHLATRGVPSSALLTSVWLCGPEFLYNECSFHPESSVPTLNDSVSTLNDPVPEERNKILSINPFLDNSGILRVGGRLRHINIAYGHKHPILLPKGHILTDLIVRHYHEILLHAGPQLVQSSIQEQYWIIGARDVIRHLIRKCVKCCRIRASITNQMTSDLPITRISPSPTFLRCGVDYAGPFQIRTSKGRGSKSFKAYIALFVCFTTRAIHLELVTDLSADVFIAALKRFIFRRGKCSDIYSDCSSNFVGAKRKLMEFEKIAKSKNYNQNVNNFLSDNGIKWHLNVPGAPHMGGLWEAGIKSTKYHLKRVVGEAKLTYEEFETFLTQIEACVNSRPLTAISNDPNDLSVLTPGHFIIGRALTSIPEPNYIMSKISYLTRWQLIQKMVQQFWKRWHNEYLCRLQQRPKWLLPTKNFQINDLCLIKDDNLPSTKWKMGRIIQLHPGLDNIVRVVTIKTADGTFKRNITKLCMLLV
ncbi:reverse transcriptase [Caerostris darwini]|uniref:Reverse transcriptase n=1 Tax=Caerostris darwini TaxID=1538125 RepID=A0AAV4M661_9ARAC|nr:reverse transcriptase [Caerostris darwini]